MLTRTNIVRAMVAIAALVATWAMLAIDRNCTRTKASRSEAAG
jgi:hypothetical protein